MPIDWIVEFTHSQFALRDAGCCSNFSVNDEQLANRAALNEDLDGFTVFTSRYGHFLRLQIEVADCRPVLNFDEWDHVVELCFITLTGELEISTTCGSDVYDSVTRELQPGRLHVGRGACQVYVLYANLSSMERQLSEAAKLEAGFHEHDVLMYGRPEDGVAGIPDWETLNTFDHYRIILWPVRDKVVKRHNKYS